MRKFIFVAVLFAVTHAYADTTPTEVDRRWAQGVYVLEGPPANDFFTAMNKDIEKSSQTDPAKPKMKFARWGKLNIACEQIQATTKCEFNWPGHEGDLSVGVFKDEMSDLSPCNNDFYDRENRVTVMCSADFLILSHGLVP